MNIYAQSRPIDVVKNIFEKAKNHKIIKNKKSQAQINKHINFHLMAKNALGSKFKTISQAEFNWFKKTLQAIIIKTVYPEAPKFLKNVQIDYEDVEVEKNKATVLSVVSKKGEETEVNYVLTKIKSRWIVMDISLDDDSWVESIRDQVIKTINKNKWSGLKTKLQNRLNELKSK